jgi:hypothetical protein
VRRLGAIPLVTLLTCAAACSYDWEIGAPSADAGTGGADAGAGSGGSGAGGAAPDCAMLSANLDAARKQAKACTIGASGQCGASITDECGCTSYVTQGGSAAASAFADAVAKVKAAGCTTSCSSCLVSPGACLYSGGKGPYCLP